MLYESSNMKEFVWKWYWKTSCSNERNHKWTFANHKGLGCLEIWNMLWGILVFFYIWIPKLSVNWCIGRVPPKQISKSKCIHAESFPRKIWIFLVKTLIFFYNLRWIPAEIRVNNSLQELGNEYQKPNRTFTKLRREWFFYYFLQSL